MLRPVISVLTLILVLGPIVTATPASIRAAQSATPTPALGLDGVVVMATGGCHALVLRVDGTVWGWGCDSDWELGATRTLWDDPAKPIQAVGLDQVRSIASGSDHGLALRADGSVWAWGKNDYGQVGVPQGENCPYHPRPCVQTPVAVPGLSGIKAVAAMEDSSFALGADGTVWAWGDNGNGQLGTGSGADSLFPIRVEGVSDIVSLSAVGARVVALRGDGAVWGWGWSLWGGSPEQATPVQVSELNDVVAVAAGEIRNLALKADGTVWVWGARGNPTPVVVAGLGPLTAIAGGALLSGAVAADGTIWDWGLSMSATPVPPTQVEDLSDIVAITMGLKSNLALRADGTVWDWKPNGHSRQIPAPAAGTPTP